MSCLAVDPALAFLLLPAEYGWHAGCFIHLLMANYPLGGMLSPLVGLPVQTQIMFVDKQTETLYIWGLLIYRGVGGWAKECKLNVLPGYKLLHWLLTAAALTNCMPILLIFATYRNCTCVSVCTLPPSLRMRALCFHSLLLTTFNCNQLNFI